MTLSEMQKGERGVVRAVALPLIEKERLRAVGVFTGETLCLLKASRRKKTFIVRVQSSGIKVALGRETAAGVDVWKA